MDNNTTRISDLPENITLQSMDSMTNKANIGSGMGMGMGETTYNPMNIHPNPYGNQQMNPTSMPNPQQTGIQRTNTNQYQQMGAVPPQQQQMYTQPPPQSQYLTEDQIIQMQQQRLPSRDIPNETTNYVQDEQIKPNYIPKSNVSSDFVREYEKTTEQNMREYEEKKKRENKMDDLFNEFQTPIFIAVLFFLFQLPIINTMIFKKFSFLDILKEDGNFNTSGLLFKSMIFGSLYYFAIKTTNFLAQF
jgi:hypothetical protein